MTTKEEVIAQTRIEIFHERTGSWGLLQRLSYSGHQEMKFSGVAGGADDSSAANRHKKKAFFYAVGRQPELDTPFEGVELTGRVKSTFLRGNLIYDNGIVLGSPRGRYLKRPYGETPKTSHESG